MRQGGKEARGKGMRWSSINNISCSVNKLFGQPPVQLLFTLQLMG